MDNREKQMAEMEAHRLSIELLEIVKNKPYDIVCNAIAMVTAGVASVAEEDGAVMDRHAMIAEIAIMTHHNAEVIKTMGKPPVGN